MICIDTDVFIRDLLNPNDDKALFSRELIQRTSNIDRCTTIFNILEICGVLSVARNSDVKTTFIDFHRDKTLKIIYPNFKEYGETHSFFKNMIDNCLTYMERQMGTRIPRFYGYVKWRIAIFLSRGTRGISTEKERSMSRRPPNILKAMRCVDNTNRRLP